MAKKRHDKISVAVDCLIFTIENDQLKILLIRRTEEPNKDQLALPGAAVYKEEAIIDAARRCLQEETGVTEPIYMEQLYTWGDDCERDPRDRVISISYMALIPREIIKEQVGVRVSEVCFYNVEELLNKNIALAFDHREMLVYGRDRLRNKTEYTSIAFNLLSEEFTLPELQKIYEILLGKKLYKANFRKSIQDFVEDTGKMKKEGAHRPSKVYRKKENDAE